MISLSRGKQRLTEPPSRRRWYVTLALVALAAIAFSSGAFRWMIDQYRDLTFEQPKRLEQSAIHPEPSEVGGVGSTLPQINPKSRFKGHDLTLKQTFPGEVRKVSYKSAFLRLVGARVNGDCSSAAWGDFRSSLLNGGCEQAVQGLYKGNHDDVGQVSLLRMRDAASAASVVRASVAENHAKGFLIPLDGTGVTAQLGSTKNFAFFSQLENIVVVTWVQSPVVREETAMVTALDDVRTNLSEVK